MVPRTYETPATKILTNIEMLKNHTNLQRMLSGDKILQERLQVLSAKVINYCIDEIQYSSMSLW
jgi:hypothetical protein